MTEQNQITVVKDGLLVKAPAKINLTLLIAGKRSDGYHEIETVMAKINFFDEILIQKGSRAGIELICQGPQWAPQGKENLVYQACQLLFDNCHLHTDIKITLTKNIPAGAGLGGASSDAAATLLGLSRFLELAVSSQQLYEMAGRLGSDIPFFLNGPLALCTGKGEEIRKFDQKFDFLTLLVLPDISVSTKKVYENYKHAPSLYEQLKTRINSYIEKNRFDLASEMCANMLQASCFDLHRELGNLKTTIESLGWGRVSLSGSGSAMFCILDDTDVQKSREYQHKLREKTGCKSIIVSNNRW